MTIVQALVVVVLSLLIAAVPFQLGDFFGFGAIVVTPVVLVVLLTVFGAVIARMAPTGCWVRVAFATCVIAAGYAVAMVGAMAPLAPVKSLFVVVPAPEGPSFTTALAKVLKDRGIEATPSQWSYAEDPVHYGLYAKKGAISIVSYNTEMSGYYRGYPDGRCMPAGALPVAEPGQYIVSVQPWLPCAGQAEQTAIYDDLRRDLVSRGYDVRDKQAACAAAAHEPSPKP